jgi:hypothetical protein
MTYDILAKNIQHGDLNEDEAGTAIRVCGVLLGTFQSKQLQTMCRRWAVRGVKNAKTSIMVDYIVRVAQQQQEQL